MVWLLPAALAGLAAMAGPVIVHLLRRQRARTLVVPTVRFIPSADQSVVRIRMPADIPLLLLRMAIVACAALALARPLFLSDKRAAAWADRIARVAIVDSSNPETALTDEAASAELRSATFAHRIEVAQLGPAVRRASAWLDAAPPARRELVIISDFKRGALEESALRGIPETTGIRLTPVRGISESSREIVAAAALAAEGAFDRRVRIDETSTGATFIRQPQAMSGLKLLVDPEDAQGASSLLRVISRAGAHAPLPSEPIIVRFAGGEPLPAAGEPKGWAVDAALRLMRHADRMNHPLTATIGADGALLVDVNARPGTLLAAEALKAILDTRPDPRQLTAQEIAYLPSEKLQSWSRPAAPADTSAWQRSDDSDGRWFWLAAVALLGIESWIRRGSSSAMPAREVDAHAA